MDFIKAILLLEDKPEFECLVESLEEYKASHISELSDIKNAENPQVLAYLAGGISAINIFLEQINECRSIKRSDPA